MKKVRTHKGWIIAIGNSAEGSCDLAYFIFSQDNWSCSVTRNAGYAEWEAESLTEAIEWIG